MKLFERAQKWMERLSDALVVDRVLGTTGTGASQDYATKYGVIIHKRAESAEGIIRHDRVDSTSIEPACKLIFSELDIYTKRTIETTRLKQIVLGANVRHHDNPVGGLCVAHEGILYFAADKLKNWNGSRRTFHHELFHCLDYHDDVWRYYDPVWVALNEPSFSYSAANKNKQLKSVTRPGFISNYAMSAVHEDKAELFAYMVVHQKSVQEMASNDLILRKKVEYLKNLTWSACHDFNASFWKKRLKHSVPPEQVRPEILLSLKLWCQHNPDGTEKWFVVGRDKLNAKPTVFESKEQLTDALKKLGVVEFDEVNEITGGREVEFKMKAVRAVLDEIGLDY